MKVLIRTSMILAFLCSLPILHAQTWCAVDWTLTSGSTSIASIISPSGIKLNSAGTAQTNAIIPELAANANGAISFKLDNWGASKLGTKPYVEALYSVSGASYKLRIQSDSIKITSTFRSGSSNTTSVKMTSPIVAGTSLVLEKNNGTLGIRLPNSSSYLASVALGSYTSLAASISLTIYGQSGLQISNNSKSFGCPITAYAQLSTQVGSSYFTMPIGATQLSFRFIQEYEPQAATQVFNIYGDNPDRVPIFSSSFNVHYGNNWVNTDIAALVNGIYTLEVTTNKGEKYFLRFKKQ